MLQNNEKHKDLFFFFLTKNSPLKFLCQCIYILCAFWVDSKRFLELLVSLCKKQTGGNSPKVVMMSQNYICEMMRFDEALEKNIMKSAPLA